MLGTGSEFEIMQQMAEVPTNDFGVLVMPKGSPWCRQ